MKHLKMVVLSLTLLLSSVCAYSTSHDVFVSGWEGFEIAYAEDHPTKTIEIRNYISVEDNIGQYFYDNLTIESLQGDNWTFSGNGKKGFIFEDGKQIWFNNISFEGFDSKNYEDGNGGVIQATAYSTITFGGTLTFRNNEANLGGAAYFVNSRMEIANSSIDFIANISTSSSWGGGAMYFSGNSVLNISDSQINFTINSATFGGALALQAKSFGEISNSKINFTGNLANGGGGAIILNNASTLTFSNSNINFIDNKALGDNKATNGGGAIYIHSGDSIKGMLGFINSTVSFIGNISEVVNGGAIYALGASSIVFSGSSISFISNSANNGGAIYFSGSNHKIFFLDTNANFIGNTAKSSGGAIYMADKAELTLNVEKNKIIFSGNKANDNDNDIYMSNAILNIDTHKGQVEMYDGIYAIAGSSITKIGQKVFILSGKNDFSQLGLFNVLKGTLSVRGAIFNYISNSTHIYVNDALMEFKNSSSIINFTSNSVLKSGGAFYIENSTLSFTNVNVNFTSNSAFGAELGGGGAIAAIRSSISFNRSNNNSKVNFTSNITNGNGGAIGISTGSILTFNNSKVVNFTSNQSGNAGAILVYYESQIIANNDNGEINFISNIANGITDIFSGFGGALLISYGSNGDFIGGKINFIENQSKSNSGGALTVASQNGLNDNDRKTARLRFVDAQVNFTSNSSNEGGAISVSGGAEIYFNGGKVNFTSNIATTHLYDWVHGGGAIFADKDSSIVFNSEEVKFVDNVSQASGGAIYAQDSSITFITDKGFVLFSGNKASGMDNDIYLSSSTLNLLATNNEITMYGGINAVFASTINISGLSKVNLDGINHFKNSFVNFLGANLYLNNSTITFEDSNVYFGDVSNIELNSSKLVFDISKDNEVNIKGEINGFSGTIEKIGIGDFRLGGLNNFSGNFNIEAGTLTLITQTARLGHLKIGENATYSMQTPENSSHTTYVDSLEVAGILNIGIGIIGEKWFTDMIISSNSITVHNTSTLTVVVGDMGNDKRIEVPIFKMINESGDINVKFSTINTNIEPSIYPDPDLEYKISTSSRDYTVYLLIRWIDAKWNTSVSSFKDANITEIVLTRDIEAVDNESNDFGKRSGGNKITIYGGGYKLNANHIKSGFELDKGKIGFENITIENFSSEFGGAIFASNKSVITLDSKNGSITFSGNELSDGLKPNDIFLTSSSLILKSSSKDKNIRLEGGIQAMYDSSIEISGKGGLYLSGINRFENMTIFSGNQARITVENSTFSYQFSKRLYINASTIVYVDDEVKFANNLTDVHGGAIWSESSSINFRDSKIEITSNQSQYKGGALYLLNNSTFDISTSTINFINNIAIENGKGGTVYLENSNVNFNDSSVTFKNNLANGVDGKGGAIYAEAGSTIIFNNSAVIFENNESTKGGAIFAQDSSITFVADNGKVLFVGNKAAGTDNDIYMSSSTLNLFATNNEISLNGGIEAVFGSTINITGTKLYLSGVNKFEKVELNIAPQSSIKVENASFSYVFNKGLKLNDSKVEFVSSRVNFSSNTSSEDGGAISVVNGARLVLENVSFIDNKAGQEGGAIYMSGNSNAISTVTIGAINMDVTFWRNNSRNGINDIYMDGYSELELKAQANKKIEINSGIGTAADTSNNIIRKTGAGQLNLGGHTDFKGRLEVNGGTLSIVGSDVKLSTVVVGKNATFMAVSGGLAETIKLDKIEIKDGGYLGINLYFDKNAINQQWSGDLIKTSSIAISSSNFLVIKSFELGEAYDGNTKNLSIPILKIIGDDTITSPSGGFASGNFSLGGYTTNYNIVLGENNTSLVLNLLDSTLEPLTIFALNHNQEEVQTMLNKIDDNNQIAVSLRKPINKMAADGQQDKAKKALNDLSGEFILDVLTLATSNNDLIILDRIHPDEKGIWVQSNLNAIRDDKNMIAELKSDGFGAQVGSSLFASKSSVLGIYVGYGTKTLKQNLNKADMDDLQIGLYGGQFGKKASLRYSLSGGMQEFTTNRSVEFVQTQSKAEFNTYTIKAVAEVEYIVELNKQIAFKPFIGLQGGYVRNDLIKEQGREEKLQIAANNFVRLNSLAGLKLEYDENKFNWYMKFYGGYLLSGNNATYKLSFAEAAKEDGDMNISVEESNNIFGGLGAGINIKVSKHISIFTSIDTNVGADLLGYNANLGVMVGFGGSKDPQSKQQKSEKQVIETKEPTVITFHLDSYELTDQAKTIIKRLAQKVKNRNLNKIVIKGYTSAMESNTDENMVLSKNRAKAVYDELHKNGVDYEKMDYLGFDSLQPMATNETQEGRQQNRRAEVIIE